MSSMSVRPLPAGTIIRERYEVADVLGTGGFAVAYRAKDNRLSDWVVVKELAPQSATRAESGAIDLDPANREAAGRLRQRFLEEAALLGKIKLPGVLPVRESFIDNGTAYYVTPFIEGAITLDHVIANQGRLHADEATDILYQLLETLEELHKQRILHHDIKPSNVLISTKGEAYLIDFGAAREWQADVNVQHTVLFTPGYAPLEQMAERGKRGPATDLYALSATAYHMLAGQAPPPSPERASGRELPSLRILRPDLDTNVAEAIEQGLALKFGDRPRNILRFRELLAGPTLFTETSTVEDYDKKAVRLRTFKIGAKECPSCGGLLEEPKPLKPDNCPVCRMGHIKNRKIAENACPVCCRGVMHRVKNEMVFCPKCRFGTLDLKRKGLLGGKFDATCNSCKSEFSVDKQQVTFADESHTWAEWRERSNRQLEAYVCTDCHAQLDIFPGGQVQLMTLGQNPHKSRRVGEYFYPEEWWRIAAGIAPGAGNACCDSCSADFYREGNDLTLVDCHLDPFGFGEEFLGRLIHRDQMPWLGAGKFSGEPGLLCATCFTEFDYVSGGLALVRSANTRLTAAATHPKTLHDWGRIAHSLPQTSEEEDFELKFDETIRGAYRSGKINLEDNPDLLWSGPATRVDDSATGQLRITMAEVRFGGFLKKARFRLDEVAAVEAVGVDLFLELQPNLGQVGFTITPIELKVRLSSATRALVLDVNDLFERLKAALEVLERSNTGQHNPL